MSNKSDAHEVGDYNEYQQAGFSKIHKEVDAMIGSIAHSHLRIKDKKLLLIEVMQKFQKEILTKI
jgi:uncharacterized glyoxalase superfamily protein PhnB